MHSLIPLSLLLSCLSHQINAHTFPVEIQVRHPSGKYAKRASTNIPISNTGNAQYISNITVAGVELPVLLDTGSSDFWVHFPDGAPQTTNLGKSVTLSYAVGRAKGNVHAAPVKFDNYTVKDQAFLLVTDTSTFTSDIHAQGFDGLLGLGPNEGSVIYDEIDSAAGNSLLYRIFAQDKSTSNFISFLLDRKGDPSDPFTGQLTVSQIVPGFENITSMPKLDVDEVNRLLDQDQHWQVLTDKKMGIVGPDGHAITVPSLVRKAPQGQFVAVIDSGFTFSQVPREVSDQIYGRVKGAVYDRKNEWWTVPCGQYLNISFNFGGVYYPVHPLDTVDNNFNQFDPTGNPVCIGAFQPITSAFSLLGHYDIILGMSFLRNAYTLLDFGDWIESNKGRGSPYVQMASITNVAQAREDFIKIRLSGVDTINDARWQLVTKEKMQHSPVSDEEKKKKYQEAVLSKWPYILLGCLVLVLGLIGLCVWKCCCNKRGKKGGAGASRGLNLRGGKGGKNSRLSTVLNKTGIPADTQGNASGSPGYDKTGSYYESGRGDGQSQVYLPLKEGHGSTASLPYSSGGAPGAYGAPPVSGGGHYSPQPHQQQFDGQPPYGNSYGGQGGYPYGGQGEAPYGGQQSPYGEAQYGVQRPGYGGGQGGYGYAA